MSVDIEPGCGLTNETCSEGLNRQSAADLLVLNRTCRCWPIATSAVVDALPQQVRAVLDGRHEHLFAATGVFVHSTDLAAMTTQIQAIEAVARLPDYQARLHALQQSSAGTDARRSRGLSGPAEQRATRGVLMGYDFHLTAAGPRLIEINTNAGGAFLVSHLEQTPGLSERYGATVGLPRSAVGSATRLADMFQQEWRLAGRSGRPASIAVVDDHPHDQYLFSDMLLAVAVLREHFTHVVVVDRADLRWTGDKLQVAGTDQTIDMVYNRLTDFMLTEPASDALAAAFFHNSVVLTPSPVHHVLLANKLNLQLLSDPQLRPGWDLSARHREALAELPLTVAVAPDNADALWQQRKSLFFKPAAGFGGRAAYRGARLSRKVWAAIVADCETQPYVAQAQIPPSQRVLAAVGDPGVCVPAPESSAALPDRLLKFDVRVYSYAAEPLMLAARVYEGQTTNFRTPGGGFAPVALTVGTAQ